jgi:hypothetical protein
MFSGSLPPILFDCSEHKLEVVKLDSEVNWFIAASRKPPVERLDSVAN